MGIPDIQLLEDKNKCSLTRYAQARSTFVAALLGARLLRLGHARRLGERRSLAGGLWFVRLRLALLAVAPLLSVSHSDLLLLRCTSLPCRSATLFDCLSGQTGSQYESVSPWPSAITVARAMPW
jgi:hypothetical protein